MMAVVDLGADICSSIVMKTAAKSVNRYFFCRK